MAMEIAISYQATVLIQILVNIAMGDVNGIYEQTFIRTVSTLPLAIENITTKKAMIKRNVIGITDVLILSRIGNNRFKFAIFCYRIIYAYSRKKSRYFL